MFFNPFQASSTPARLVQELHMTCLTHGAVEVPLNNEGDNGGDGGGGSGDGHFGDHEEGGSGGGFGGESSRCLLSHGLPSCMALDHFTSVCFFINVSLAPLGRDCTAASAINRPTREPRITASFVMTRSTMDAAVTVVTTTEFVKLSLEASFP